MEPKNIKAGRSHEDQLGHSQLRGARWLSSHTINTVIIWEHQIYPTVWGEIKITSCLINRVFIYIFKQGQWIGCKMFMRVKINQETKRKFPRWMDALGYTPNTCIHSPLPAKWECLRSTGINHALAKAQGNIHIHTYI